jgi:hypothetical protein
MNYCRLCARSLKAQFQAAKRNFLMNEATSLLLLAFAAEKSDIFVTSEAKKYPSIP